MKTIYQILLTFLIFFSQGFSPVLAGVVSGRLDEYHLGSWAYRQHNSICAILHPSIQEGRLKTIKAENKLLSKEQALSMLETQNVAFISTSSDDPTKGYDTSFYAPMKEHFYSFTLTDQEVIVKTGEKSKAIVFNLSEFNSILSTDMRLYLDMYKTGQEVLYSRIPLKSSILMRDINLKLHQEGKAPLSRLYMTDSLTGLFSQEDKESRGRTEYRAFISTDPDDLSVGRDTLVTVPLAESMKDSSSYQSLYFAMHGAVSCLKLSGLSAGYMVSISGFGLSMHYGFLEYGSIHSLSPAEKTMIESSLLHHIEDRMLPFGNGYADYMEKFGLNGEAGSKKNR